MSSPSRSDLRQVILRGLAGVLGASGLGLGASGWMVISTRNLRTGDARSVPHRPVAVVPGARVLRNGSPSPVLEQRLQAALDLHRAGRVERILVSGTGREVRVMARWLVQHGCPAATLQRDALGLRTRSTMERAVGELGVRRAVICTQAFHLPRAVYLARRAGIDAVGLEADAPGYRPAIWTRLREHFARQMALVESHILPL